ncbi:MAG TPA: hypothetical protein VFW30_06430 [Bryocella sp.]|nr:hypothetical protein [Bryocella sp.]
MCSSVRKASAVPFYLLILGSLVLTGCSGKFVPGPVTLNQTPIGTIQGNVHGGNFPVSGAQIYLLAAGQGGYGTSATSLITAGANGVSCSNPAVSGACYVTTDANGNFALTGDYTCTEGQQVYMVGVGGNPGLSGTVNNTAIVQMAAMAACPASGSLASAVPYVTLNEVTTVAFAYAMGGFATTAYNVSSSATGETALANALANANKIVNLQWGQAPTVANGNATSTNPQSKIYALANVLATCVNTISASSSQCTNLFKYATASTGTVATDEANAIFNIAHSQGQNVANIYNLAGSTGPFSPSLNTTPSDWTLPVVYPGVVSTFGTNANNQVISGAYNIAFDASGNAWIGDRVKGIVEMTPMGAVTTYNPGFSMVKGIAVSPDSSQIWVADYSGGTGNGQLDIMSTGGTITTSFVTDMDGPSAIAVDANGYAFVVNELNGSVVGLTPTGGFVAYSGAVGVTTPAWISIDQNNNLWLPSTMTNQVVGQIPLKYAGASGKFKSFGTIATIAADYSYGVAVDSSNNMWFATNAITGAGAPNNESLDEIQRAVTTNRNGKQIVSYNLNSSEVGYGWNGGGLGIPYKISVDGGNNVWTANEYYPTVSEWSQSQGGWMGVPGTQGLFGIGEVDGAGFSNASSGTTLSATPDPSGNLWTANTDGTVTELIGLATPTASPIYPGVFGTMP